MGEDKTKRAHIPTDAQVVREFIAEAEAFNTAADNALNEAESFMKAGNAEARLALASRLEYVKNQRAELVAEAAEKVAEGFAEMGRKISSSLKDAFDKANAKADK